MYKVTRLDKRHSSGYGLFKYFISIPPGANTIFNDRTDFFLYREWCWKTWGASKELSEWRRDRRAVAPQCQNQHWCWENNQYHARIYLMKDEDLVFFKLSC